MRINRSSEKTSRSSRKVNMLLSGLTVAVLILSILTAFSNVNAQQVPTDKQIIDANLGGPVFLDAYWINRDATGGSSSSSAASSSVATTPVRKEVRPNEGAATLAVVLVNRGYSDITAITGHLSLPQGFSPNGIGSSPTIADASSDKIVNAGDTFTLYFDLDVSNNTHIGMYSADLDVQYSLIRELGSFRHSQVTVPIKLTGKAILAVSSSLGEANVTSQIAAGKIEDYSFHVANRGTAPITNVVITMTSSSESLKILGDSRWTIDRIEKDSQVDLATKVFAASTLIGNPASFDVTIEYSSDGQLTSEKFTLGTYVGGEINVRIYDLAINYVGATPTLVGNILNEGNTAALFTTIELVQSPEGNQSPTRGNNTNENQVGASSGNFARQLSRPPSPQYLGDLTANSPLPFSIPLTTLGNSQQASFPVTLKISYKDNLRNSHEFVVTDTAFRAQQAITTNFNAQARIQTQDFAGLPLIVWIGIAIAAAAAGISAVIIKRRVNAKKSKNRLPSSSPEKRENIEDILQNPQDGNTKKAGAS